MLDTFPLATLERGPGGEVKTQAKPAKHANNNQPIQHYTEHAPHWVPVNKSAHSVLSVTCGISMLALFILSAIAYEKCLAHFYENETGPVRKFMAFDQYEIGPVKNLAGFHVVVMSPGKNYTQFNLQQNASGKTDTVFSVHETRSGKTQTSFDKAVTVSENFWGLRGINYKIVGKWLPAKHEYVVHMYRQGP